MNSNQPLTDADVAPIKVRICDKRHPHYGEAGILTGEVIVMKFSGQRMAKVQLTQCQHGTDGCYVSPGQVERDPYA